MNFEAEFIISIFKLLSIALLIISAQITMVGFCFDRLSKFDRLIFFISAFFSAITVFSDILWSFFVAVIIFAIIFIKCYFYQSGKNKLFQNSR